MGRDRDHGKFCVNVLRNTQADLCWRFAKSDVSDDRFDGLAWRPSTTGCPIIEGVGAWIDCEVSETIPLATTTSSSGPWSSSITTPNRRCRSCSIAARWAGSRDDD